MYHSVAEKKQRDYVKSEIEKIKLPKDWNNWLQQVVFNDEYIMFVKNEDKQKLGFCQFCKNKEIHLRNEFKIGQTLKCPICDHLVKVKNYKFYKSTLNIIEKNKKIVSLFTKLKKGYLLINYEVLKSYNLFEVKFNTYLKECCFKTSINEQEQWFHLSSVFTKEGYKEVLAFGPFNNMGYELPYYNILYTKNLTFINKIKELKYCPLKEYAEKVICNPFSYIKLYAKFPSVIEKLTKVNLCGILLSSMNLNYLYKLNAEGKDLKNILNLKFNSTVKFAIKNNINAWQLECLQWLERNNYKLTSQNLKAATILLDSSIENQNLIFNYFNFYSFSNYINDLNLSNLKTNFIIDFCDYLKNAEVLKYDLRNTMYLKPKNFKLAHDIAADKVASIKNKKLYDDVKKILKKYKKLEYEKGNYCVIIPTSAEDIIKEGRDMNNCVGSYLGRIKENRSIVAFIRKVKNPHKSFYTIEINPKDLKIVQCRGPKNEKTPEEKQVQSFAQNWQKEIVSKLLTA